MVSVGALAAIINISSLILVAICERIASFVLRAISVSKEDGISAPPEVSPQDTSLLNIPISIVKFRRSPAADIVTEFGVHSSQRCAPQVRYGQVTASSDTSSLKWTEERQLKFGHITIFSQIQTIPFIENDWSFVASGFPVDISSTVCIKCLDTVDRPSILRDCHVENGATYSAGELFMGIHLTDSLKKTVSIGFNETKEAGTSYLGTGDLILQKGCSIFSFHIDAVNDTSNATVTYFEYGNNTHCREILFQSKKLSTPLWVQTKGPTYTQKITCSKSILQATTFRDAISIYRTVQLEYSLHRQDFDVGIQRFPRLTANDIYRAVLAGMLANINYEQGEYWEYSECGQYQWKYLIPLIVALSLLLLLTLLSASILIRKHMQRKMETPPPGCTDYFDDYLVDTEGSSSWGIPSKLWSMFSSASGDTYAGCEISKCSVGYY